MAYRETITKKAEGEGSSSVNRVVKGQYGTLHHRRAQ